MSPALRLGLARSDAAATLGPTSGASPATRLPPIPASSSPFDSRGRSLLASWLVVLIWLAWTPGAEAEPSAVSRAPSADAPNAPAPAPAFRLHLLFDGATLASSLGLGVTLEMLLNTSELTPQPPGEPEDLLVIDRWRAESDTFERSGLSNIGRALVIGYALTDTVLVDLLDRGEPWFHYAIIYAESAAITLVLTDITKIAVRRPRPTAYAARQDGELASSQTNTSLSFFSGHASLSAAISATAIYFAFVRTDDPLERWLIFTGGVLLTLGVSTARVLEGEHFPTDVIAGISVGTAVGLVVPQLHRRRASSAVGLQPHPWGGRDAAGLSLSHAF